MGKKKEGGVDFPCIEGGRDCPKGGGRNETSNGGIFPTSGVLSQVESVRNPILMRQKKGGKIGIKKLSGGPRGRRYRQTRANQERGGGGGKAAAERGCASRI